MRRRLTQTVAPTIMALTAAAWIAGPAGAASDIPKAHFVDKTPPSESADSLTDRQVGHPQVSERSDEVNRVPAKNLTGPEMGENTERELNGDSDPIPAAHKVDRTPPSESVD